MRAVMRRLALILLTLLTAACLAPGERDPTRYPWDQPQRRATSKSDYCIMSLELGGASGITAHGATRVNLACKPPPPRSREPQSSSQR